MADGALRATRSDVVLRLDVGHRRQLARPPIAGAHPVAAFLHSGARMFALLCRPALVNGGAGIVVGRPGRIVGVVAIMVGDGRVRAVDIVADPDKLRRVRLDEPPPPAR